MPIALLLGRVRDAVPAYATGIIARIFSQEGWPTPAWRRRPGFARAKLQGKDGLADIPRIRATRAAVGRISISCSIPAAAFPTTEALEVGRVMDEEFPRSSRNHSRSCLSAQRLADARTQDADSRHRDDPFRRCPCGCSAIRRISPAIMPDQGQHLPRPRRGLLPLRPGLHHGNSHRRKPAARRRESSCLSLLGRALPRPCRVAPQRSPLRPEKLSSRTRRKPPPARAEDGRGSANIELDEFGSTKSHRRRRLLDRSTKIMPSKPPVIPPARSPSRPPFRRLKKPHGASTKVKPAKSYAETRAVLDDSVRIGTCNYAPTTHLERATRLEIGPARQRRHQSYLANSPLLRQRLESS